MWRNRVVVPEAVYTDILELAHEGHHAEQSMLQQWRQMLWWLSMSKVVKGLSNHVLHVLQLYPETCLS